MTALVFLAVAMAAFIGFTFGRRTGRREERAALILGRGSK